MESLPHLVHHLADLLVRRSLDDDEAQTLRRELEKLIEQVEAIDPQSLEERKARFVSRMATSGDDVTDQAMFESFPESPFSGSQNALAPIDIQLRRDGDDVVADVVAGPAYEGAPGRAHGGFVAAVFDDVIGAVQRFLPINGFTRTLTVEYLRPFPLENAAEVRARLVDQDDTTFELTSEATFEGRIVARAHAVFTTLTNKEFADRAIPRHLEPEG